MCHSLHYRVFRLRPSSGTLNNITFRKLDLSFRPQVMGWETAPLLCPLDVVNFNHSSPIKYVSSNT
jgi:hypothetical protein